MVNELGLALVALTQATGKKLIHLTYFEACLEASRFIPQATLPAGQGGGVA